MEDIPPGNGVSNARRNGTPTPPVGETTTTITATKNSRKRKKRPTSSNNPKSPKSPRFARTSLVTSQSSHSSDSHLHSHSHTHSNIQQQRQRIQRHQLQQNQQRQRNIRHSLQHQPQTDHSRQVANHRLQQLGNQQQHLQLSISHSHSHSHSIPSQSQQQQRQVPAPTHTYTATYFNNYSSIHKSTLNVVFNGLSQDIQNYKSKGIIVGMKMEILNSVIQEHRRHNGATTFIDMNGQSQALTFKNFVTDKYVGDGNGQFEKESDIKNIRQNTKNFYDKKDINGLFTNAENERLFQQYEQALQSNVKFFIFWFLFLYISVV